MWNINVNATCYDYENMICELMVMRDYNNDAVLNNKECNAVISKQNIHLFSNCCFLYGSF